MARYWLVIGSLLAPYWVIIGSLLSHYWLVIGSLLGHYCIIISSLLANNCSPVVGEDVVFENVLVHWFKPGEPNQLLVHYVNISPVPLTIPQIPGEGRGLEEGRGGGGVRGRVGVRRRGGG